MLSETVTSRVVTGVPDRLPEVGARRPVLGTGFAPFPPGPARCWLRPQTRISLAAPVKDLPAATRRHAQGSALGSGPLRPTPGTADPWLARPPGSTLWYLLPFFRFLISYAVS